MDNEIVYHYQIVEYRDGWYRVRVFNEITGHEHITHKLSRIEAANYLCLIMDCPEFVFEKTEEIAV